jgi:hypothetical protein
MSAEALAERHEQSESVPRPHSASEWVLRCSSAGLCNRLRAVLSHYLAALEHGALLTVVWAPSDQCPGHFTELFEPLAGVRFVTDYEPLARTHGDEAAQPLDIESNDYHESVAGRSLRIEHCWTALTLLPELCEEVDANVRACSGDFVAIHVRRTDHRVLYEPLALAMHCAVADSDFERFCDAHPEAPIFVATDCVQAQQHFRSSYPARCCVGRHTIGHRTGTPSLRQTSLRASAVDLFTCVEATVFKGSPFSSFSDAICHLRAGHGASHPLDEHTPELAPCDTPHWRTTILASAHEQAAQGNTLLKSMLQSVGVLESRPAPCGLKQ